MSPETAKLKPGEFLFAVLFLLLSVFLLSQLGDQTNFSSKGKLFSQPAFWPAVSVIGMTGFTALHVLLTFRSRARSGTLAEAFIWLRGLEFVGWLMIYVNAVPIIGYLSATIIFTVTLALRMGYRNPRTLAYAGLSGLAIVLIFKTILSVKIPGGAIYKYLPDALRNFMITNF